MSSVSNYSVWQLHTIFIARQDAFGQLHDERLTAQQTRLVQRNGNSRSLTLEQQNLSIHVSEVCNALACCTTDMLSKFYAYDQAEPNDQPGIRDQIEALIGDLGMKMQYCEGKVREFEGM